MATPDPLQLATTVRNTCVLAALEGYERAQIAGLCQEGAFEAAVDAMRMLDLASVLQALTENQAPSQRPASEG